MRLPRTKVRAGGLMVVCATALVAIAGCRDKTPAPLMPTEPMYDINNVVQLTPIQGQTQLYTNSSASELSVNAKNASGGYESFCGDDITWSTNRPDLITLTQTYGAGTCSLQTSRATIAPKGIAGSGSVTARARNGAAQTTGFTVQTLPAGPVITSWNDPAPYSAAGSYTYTATISNCTTNCRVQWTRGPTAANEDQTIIKEESNVGSTSVTAFLNWSSTGYVRLAVANTSTGATQFQFWQFNVAAPTAPAGLTPSVTGSLVYDPSYPTGMAHLSWGSVTGATSYRIYRTCHMSDGYSPGWELWSETSQTNWTSYDYVMSYGGTTQPSGSYMAYYVVATGSGGDSNPSPIVYFNWDEVAEPGC